MLDRSAAIELLRQYPEVAVLVIGGGINGIGTWRELALQGLDVFLIEKNDYCSGASAASSHMIHGGIRYLENGEFRLVKEAVQERNRLIENAPGLVKPLPTVIPIFQWLSGILNAPLKFINLRNKPAERGALVIKIGLWLYDAYTKVQGTVPKHKMFSKTQSLNRFPALNTDIKLTAQYYDAAMLSPERIAISLLRDTSQKFPKARTANYIEVNGIHGDHVILRDMVTEEVFSVKPRVVVNAAGAWIDQVNQKISDQKQLIGGTKGSHIILDSPELSQQLNGHEIFFENDDGRIVLIFPLLDKVMIGTTDIPIEDPDEAVCTPEEVNYFLEMVKKVFPSIKVDDEQIIYRFSGVRPLPTSVGRVAGQISRDHSIKVDPANAKRSYPVYSLVGGKWTTFRAFSEQVADQILRDLGLPRKESSRYLKIGNEFDQALMRSEIPSDELVLEVLKEEGVIHLEDLVLRRTMIAKLGLLDLKVLERLGKLCAEQLGWDDQRLDNELAQTKQTLLAKHAVMING